VEIKNRSWQNRKDRNQREQLNKMMEKAQQFLHENNLKYENINFEAEIVRFIDQMALGLNSDDGLPMVPTYVSGQLHPKQGGKTIAVDVGGTNLSVALLEIKNLRTCIIDIVKEPSMGKVVPVTFDVFIKDLVDKIEPFLKHSKTICFSFSHEVKHTNDMDGCVKFISKEISITDFEDRLLADSLKQVIEKRIGVDVKVLLINDTVGVAGSMLQHGDEFQNYIGVVLGTGTNACYIEQCKNIKKTDDAKTETMFINVESGAYIPLIVSTIDQEFDATTLVPNTAILEKMVSGEYLGKLYYFLIQKACGEGLFSDGFNQNFEKHEPLGTKALSAFYQNKSSGVYAEMCADKCDVQLLYFFATCLIKRAAALISIKIIAISRKIYQQRNAPICVVVEGSTYYGLKGFQDMVLKYIEANKKDMDVKLFSVEDAALVGIGNIGLAFE
jgi:hexokinase